MLIKTVNGNRTNCPRCGRAVEVEIYDGGGITYCCEYQFSTFTTYMTEITDDNRASYERVIRNYPDSPLAKAHK